MSPWLDWISQRSNCISSTMIKGKATTLSGICPFLCFLLVLVAGVRGNLKVVLTGVFLKAKGVKHFKKCVLAIGMFSFGDISL